ncbi:hypothetical protein L1887_14438 [Cichorium endivia]|nr:hypothetical protein L1887_14438 [Cichorium endivia]
MMAGAQWTVIVTTIAIEKLKSGMVEVVVCVQRTNISCYFDFGIFQCSPSVQQNATEKLHGLFLGYYRRRNKIFSVLYWMVSLKLLLHVAAIY